jgi:hypothetical protein
MNDPIVIKFGEWWDGESFSDDNPYRKDSFAYWSWEGWQAGWKANKGETMKRPIETNYTSHVAYTRALEEYCNKLEKKGMVRVSPFEFGNMTFEKEDAIGEPLFWSQWPNERKV